jgi:hypothetical protein
VPTSSDRTRLTSFTRTDAPPRSIGIASPSTKAITSTRSLDPDTRAPITTSPAGSDAPGAGWSWLMIGRSPRSTVGLLAAMTGAGDGGGLSITVGVAV